MACAYPRDAWQKAQGVKPEFRKPPWASASNYLSIPCGKCLFCRMNQANQWALRCMHELMYHKVASYITLTYDDDHLPSDRSLDYRHIQLFLKRLRKSRPAQQIKFLATGEYGTEGGRPHYHLIIFGTDFPDKTPLRRTRAKKMLYSSESLSRIWGMGFVSVGETVTFQTCAYVAKYTVKSALGDARPEEYVDLSTGEVFTRKPEFIKVSMGLGKRFFDDHHEQIFAHDHCVFDGKTYPIPRYYDKLTAKLDPARLLSLKEARKAKAQDKPWDGSFQRLATKHTVAKLNHRIKGRGKFEGTT